MQVNVGTADRIIRFVLGVVIVIVGIIPAMEAWRIPLFVIGAILILTSFFKFCLLYKVFGIDSRRRPDGRKRTVVMNPQPPKE